MRCRAATIEWIAPLLLASLVGAQTQPAQNTASPESGAQRVGGSVSAPRAIYTPEPESSEIARKAGYEGTCVLWIVVGENGQPRDIKVHRSLGLGLDEKAIEAVRSWRFKPAMKDGHPVAVQVNVEVTFRLYSGGGKDFEKISQKADAGDANAQFEFAQLFLLSHDPSDESRGFSYLEKAAKQGLPKAQFEMGEFFSSRRNDLVTAYVWYARAQRSRFKKSDKRINELAKKMTPEQLAEARRRVDSNSPL